MTISKILITAFLLILPFNAIAKETKVVGPWSITAHYNPTTKEFSHCSASTDFTPADAEGRKVLKTRIMSVILKLFNDQTMAIGLIGYDWKFVPDKLYKTEFIFGNDLFRINLLATSDKVVESEIDPPDGKLMSMLMEHDKFEIRIEDQTLGLFPLGGSRKGLTEFMNCFGNNASTTEVNDFSFGEGTQRGE